MDVVLVPKNSLGQYWVKVLKKEKSWEIDGLKDDFFSLTEMGWYVFAEFAERVGDERAMMFLLNHGFKLRPQLSIPG